MTQFKYPLDTAAKLAEASYSADTHPSIAPKLARSLDQDDVQAHLLDNGLLLIPGSNSFMDYIRFNLRPLMFAGQRYAMSSKKTAAGASGTLWHQGFLRHAKVIYDWVEAGGAKPTYIIGHSLGAAATQILTKSWRVSGVGFAAPRTRRNRGNMAHGKLCLCLNRSDDLVASLPGSFHHLGRVEKVTARGSTFGPDHAMRHYRTAVEEGQRSGQLTKNWPR